MIIGLCGKKQHGKSTVAEFLRAEHGFKVFAFADALRAILETLDPIVADDFHYGQERYMELVARVGYEEAKKRPEVRRLLQVLGTECGRRILDEDVWVGALAKTLREQTDAHLCGGQDHVVIPDMRFENECQFIGAMQGHTVRVSRPTMPASGDMHESERYANDLLVDYTIVNNGTVDDLRLKTFAMLAKLDCSRS